LLDLVSYCLVIYYQNYKSYNSGIVTVLSNHVGDVGLLITIGVIAIYGSWNIYIIDLQRYLIYLTIILATIIKRAQIPFSTWLLIAIAAPIPAPLSLRVGVSQIVSTGQGDWSVYMIYSVSLYYIYI